MTTIQPSSNLNAGNVQNIANNVGNAGGTIQSTIAQQSGLNQSISFKDNKPNQAIDQQDIAEEMYASSVGREQIGKALYGESGAAARGYGRREFDPEKTKAISRALLNIKSDKAPEGLGYSLASGLYGEALSDFNKYISDESHRAIHETVNAYLDYQPFSKEFREAHRLDPNDRTNSWDDAWDEETQREARKDLLKQQWKGTRQVDSVFRSNNPWYEERTGAEDVQREYYDLRESGLSPQEAVEKISPRLNKAAYDSAVKGRWMYGGKGVGMVFMGADREAADLAYNPKGNLGKLESSYKSYVSQIEKPLNIDFTQKPTYIPYANPMQAEINRQNLERVYAQQDAQEKANASVQAMADLSNSIYQSGGGLYNVSQLRAAGVT